ncbi:MAG: ABC transporter substrate-binding protein [Deltaproteobacteria bacterium]|nr:ABC transporter substrate-binding protein [Deltaproteobacteria bacterium]
MIKLLLSLLIGLLIIIPVAGCAPRQEAPIGMAVEFTNHAACAYTSFDKGWYEDEGLSLSTYDSYATGMALSAALTRGDIQVAYTCLVPAINAYANAEVPIKVVAGTHKYGYALMVNPDKVKSVKDLEQEGLRIGCVQEGGAVDVVMNKLIDRYGLDKEKVLNNLQRMNPTKQMLTVKMGKLDAAFLPEQWSTMTEDYGFEMLMSTQDVWPEMQGSVLVVKTDLIENNPELVKKLVKITGKATDWINAHPEEASEVLARQLGAVGDSLQPSEVAGLSTQMEITPEVMLKSVNRMDFTTDIDPAMVQEIIDYVAELGYIKSSFDADELLDLSFLND